MNSRYAPCRLPESHTREIRGLRQHCLAWPGESAPLVLLHGFMDCGATFQFVVDALTTGRAVVAPDWRGFGRSAWPPDGYWFPDYLADLEAWLDEWCPGEPADVVGHSMGATSRSCLPDCGRNACAVSSRSKASACRVAARRWRRAATATG